MDTILIVAFFVVSGLLVHWVVSKLINLRKILKASDDAIDHVIKTAPSNALKATKETAKFTKKHSTEIKAGINTLRSIIFLVIKTVTFPFWFPPWICFTTIHWILKYLFAFLVGSKIEEPKENGRQSPQETEPLKDYGYSSRGIFSSLFWLIGFFLRKIIKIFLLPFTILKFICQRFLNAHKFLQSGRERKRYDTQMVKQEVLQKQEDRKNEKLRMEQERVEQAKKDEELSKILNAIENF